MVYFCLGVILVWQCFSLVLCCMVFSWDCFPTIYTAFTVKQTAPLLTSTHRAMIHKRYVMHTYFVGHLMKFTQRSILYCFLIICSRLSDSRNDAKMKGTRKYECEIWEKATVVGKRKRATIDPILDTRHLCTRLRTDGIKAWIIERLSIIHDESNVTWYLRGQTKEKICHCEKSHSTLFILSKLNDDLMVMQNVSLSFEKINVIIACCEDIYGRCCIQKRNKWSLPPIICYYRI